jgi:hypothetical protein
MKNENNENNNEKRKRNGGVSKAALNEMAYGVSASMAAKALINGSGEAKIEMAKSKTSNENISVASVYHGGWAWPQQRWRS